MITIIVLLILAGVTIITLFGENGLISMADKAKGETENSQANDIAGLGSLSNQMNSVLNGNGSNGGGVTPPAGAVTKGKIVEGTTNATYTDSTGTAVIPVGFCVVKDAVNSENVVTDENTVASGLVISDVKDDDLNNSKQGNQFVWIPVPKSTFDTNFHLIEGYYYGSLETMLSAGSNPSREAGASKTEILPGKPNTANTVSGTDESVAMYQSVKDNGGFYIARFEAGITDSTKQSTQNGTVKPVSKKGVKVWNNIPWGGTDSDEASDKLPGDDTADGAVKVARSMYTKSATCGVTSTLCYGVQWDAALNFIDSKYITGTCEDGTFVKDSSDMGNYLGSLATTGSYQQKHIYDLAGNVYEWTMEACDTDRRVGRGGYYRNSGSLIPASVRFSITPDFTHDSVGFRPALYL